VVARFLVTTAIEETWPESDVPILILGEWCRHYDYKSSWEHRDVVLAPYHWDDRKKLHHDYLYLKGLYEELLSELATQLNALHRVDHSLRYWRTLVGPWLGIFIQMLFDRWSMLRQVQRDNEIIGVKVLQHTDGEQVPNDMGDFVHMFINNAWNESIYGLVLDWLDVPVEKVAKKNLAAPGSGKSKSQVSAGRQIKRMLERLTSSLSGMLCREDEYFFISTYLSTKRDFHLQAKLGQLPKLWRSVAVPDYPFEQNVRRWRLGLVANNDEFASLALNLIPRQIPKAYLEGYRDLVSLSENQPWPKKPKAIFASNSLIEDDVFKAWGAQKVECGTPLVIGQHGGNYGMALWSFSEDHEMAIADHFLTWGWRKPGSSSVTPVGNLKGFDKSIASDPAGVALLVGTTFPLQSYLMYSAPVAAEQWLSYFNEQCRFVEALPTDLRAQLLVRINKTDYNHCQLQRWQVCFPDIQLDNGIQPMTRLLQNTRIYISTYNGTSFLESLSLNFPTIMFWNPEHWELRDSALPYFEKLKSVGIFHETPEGAAHQMNAVWHDVLNWWHSDEVQAVRQEFCERYAHIAENQLDVMASLFRTIAR
jgi:putative transferase (TIGR04331 family)